MTDIYKIEMYGGHPLIVELNRALEYIKEVIDEGIPGPPGKDGKNGLDGEDGWSPVMALESDSEGRYLKVVDWVGGGGEKPPVGLYVGPEGLVEEIDEAVNVRGTHGPQGEAGERGAQGADGNSLEFHWEGTSLGVRLEGESSFHYVNLQGPQGEAGEKGEGVPSGGLTGQVLSKLTDDDYSTVWVDPSGGGGGVQTFVELSDTPSNYNGQAGQVLAVNVAEDGIEFIDPPSGGGGGGESGEWIPNLAGFTPVPIIRRGYYYATDDMVFISCEVNFSTVDAPTTITIDNIPFPNDGSSTRYNAPFTVTPIQNREIPDECAGAAMITNGEIRFINRDGSLTTATGQAGFRMSGWYKRGD